MRIRLIAATPLLLCIALPCPARAAVPRTIAFQGVLSSAGGAPKPDGHYTVSLKLFPALTGGTALWTEPSAGVDVTGGKGRFTATLGTPTAFGALAFDQPYWLEVQVSGEAAPMSPRLPLMSVPYALNTSSSLSLPYSGSASVVAPGAVLAITNGAAGPAIQGTSADYYGVLGQTNTGTAIVGKATTGTGVYGSTGAVARAGISGYNTYDAGGINQSSDGVYGYSLKGPGLHGVGRDGYGILGESGKDVGVVGKSPTWVGVWGQSTSSMGVMGLSSTWEGVHGESTGGTGVVGVSRDWVGTYGFSTNNNGVWGRSANGTGVYGSADGNGVGVYGISATGYAGWFQGRVRVGILEIAGGSDLAEKFAVDREAAPGTVMAIDPKHPGALCVAEGAYSRAVAGVISGANNLNAGMVLPDAGGALGAQPIAMTGRVWVRCTAAGGAIIPGDLLTTSDAAGKAMKVTDFDRAHGATIGKAMTALESGDGLVLALVSLQ